MKRILKSTFFSYDSTLNVKALKKKWAGFDEVEFNVCSSIYRHIKPYIPKKKHYTLPCYQIPFVLLANDVLRYAGYARLAAEICPMPSTSLKRLRLDSPSLYFLFCTYETERLTSLGYRQQEISSVNMAGHQKHAVFNQFFNFSTLFQHCESRNLKFTNITILPGSKYARILVTKIRPRVPESSGESARSGRNELPWKEIGEQWQRCKDNKATVEQ